MTIVSQGIRLCQTKGAQTGYNHVASFTIRQDTGYRHDFIARNTAAFQRSIHIKRRKKILVKYSTDRQLKYLFKYASY